MSSGFPIIGCEDWDERSAPASNPPSGFARMWADSSASEFRAIDSSGNPVYFQSNAAFGGVNIQSGASYTVLGSDNGKLIVFTDAFPIAVTLPVASSFPSKFNFGFHVLGAGTVTITPTTSTIDGNATIIAAQYQGGWVFSDGTNYESELGMVSSVTASAPVTSTGGGRPNVAVSAATSSSLGVVQPDNSTITISAGVISAAGVAAAGVIGCILYPSSPAYIDIPWNFTITGWSIIGYGASSGSASVDVWFISGSAPPTAPSVPTSANKISASAPVAVSSAATAAGGSSAISTWTTALTQWGTVGFNPSSMTTFTSVQVLLFGTKS